MSEAAPIPVILNPAARSAKAASRVAHIRALSERLEIHETRGPRDARRLARELAEAGAGVIVAAGGDGTVNEVIHGIGEAAVAEKPALGLLPTGTMNVLARELALPTSDLERCWAVVEKGRVRKIDLWRAGESLFAQMAGVGLDAAVVAATSWESKKKWGPMSYAMSLFRALRRPAPVFQVVAEGIEAPLSGSAVILGNGKLYGGPFPVFRDARNDDGLLDVLVMHRHGFAEFTGLLVDVMTGRLSQGGPVYSSIRTRRLTVSTPDYQPIPVEVDGELAGFTPVTFEHAGALSVLV